MNMHSCKKNSAMNACVQFFMILLLSFSCCVTVGHAAEYQGRDIDGETFSCTAYSYSTGIYYYVQVEFDGDEAILYFPNGGHKSLTLDEEEIDDPNSISAYDYSAGVFWELEVDDLD